MEHGDPGSLYSRENWGPQIPIFPGIWGPRSPFSHDTGSVRVYFVCDLLRIQVAPYSVCEVPANLTPHFYTGSGGSRILKRGVQLELCTAEGSV